MKKDQWRAGNELYTHRNSRALQRSYVKLVGMTRRSDRYTDRPIALFFSE
jgi:hypothetical protein